MALQATTIPLEEPKTLASNEEVQPKALSEKDEVLSNPFLTREEQEVSRSTEGRLNIDYLNLSAIFYSPAGSKVIIDGKIFKEGDEVDNKKISGITPEEVILKDYQNLYFIKMKQVLGR